jgi:hypothetical protein
MGPSCEIWQFTDDMQAAESEYNCWLGKITPDSCIAKPGVWQGGARPSPNQLFTLVGDAIKSTLKINTTLPAPRSGYGVEEICMHARHESPLAMDVPRSTGIDLEPCDYQWVSDIASLDPK